MIYDLQHYDDAYEYVTTHEGYYIEDLGNKTYEVRPIPPKPIPTIEEQNEAIRQKREQAYKETSDSLYMDYQESLARGEETAEEKKQLWLSAKDKIREDNPYTEEKTVV